MKSYRYAELYTTLKSGVDLRSIDSQVLDWILAELKKVKTGFEYQQISSPLMKNIPFAYINSEVKISKLDGGY